MEQISREEFSRLFGSVRRQLRIQDENGVDAGIQYDFVPHVESETVPETATYTFFLRTEKPQIFLFDDNINDSRETQRKIKPENTPREPKDFEESKQKIKNPILDTETKFAKEGREKFIEEERQSFPYCKMTLHLLPPQSRYQNRQILKIRGSHRQC